LGRALVRRLTAAGVRVVGVDLPAALAGLPPAEAVTYLPADLLDDHQVKSLWARVDAPLAADQVVFHLAGAASVEACARDPGRAYRLNVTATANVLEACRAAGVRRVVFPSTALVYGRPAQLPVDEMAPAAPETIYAATKLAAEALLQGYAAQFGFASTVARLGNVFGPGAAADTVVARLIRQARSGGPLVVKTLAPTRDFIHSEDVADGLVRLAEACGAPGFRVFNLSSGLATSIGELALTIARLAGLPGAIWETEPDAPDAVPHLVLDTRRLIDATGWRPAVSLEAGLGLALKEMELDKA
jgi:UDP-glucose 4-epimerase